MGTLANSEDPHEMSNNVAFHQGLVHCLILTIKMIFRKIIINLLGKYNL